MLGAQTSEQRVLVILDGGSDFQRFIRGGKRDDAATHSSSGTVNGNSQAIRHRWETIGWGSDNS